MREYKRAYMPTQFVTVGSLAAMTLLLCSTVSAQTPDRGDRLGARHNTTPESAEDELETDRDSFTPATGVVGRGRLIVESAYTYIDNRHVPETHSLPELIVRYGLNEMFELRIGHNYEVGGASNPVTGNTPDEAEKEGELESGARLLYGTKILLSQQDGWIPQSSAIVQGFTPTSGESNDSNFTSTYVLGWRLPNSCVWDSAMRYATSSSREDHFNTWSPSTVLKVPVGEAWNIHAEYFGVFTEGREKESTQHFFSPGVHTLLSPDLELGLRTGWGLNEQSPNFFSNVGIGYRF
jgi:hypothetical protein